MPIQNAGGGRRVAYGAALIAAAGLAAVWLWPDLPLVFRVAYSLVLFAGVAVIGLAVLAVRLRGRARWAVIGGGLAGATAAAWVGYTKLADPAPDPPPLTSATRRSSRRGAPLALFTVSVEGTDRVSLVWL